MSIIDPRWTDSALCREVDPELFFPVSYMGPTAKLQVEAATRVCRRCPVMEECLSFALATNQPEGIWGGFTPRKRRRMREAATAAGQPYTITLPERAA